MEQAADAALSRGARAGAERASLDGRRLRIDTPENVVLELPLAGMGSRFAALLIDGAGMLLALFALGLLGVALSSLGVPDNVLGFIGILGVPLLFWGWFFAFEAFGGGRTPGKRLLGLRTVEADGGPLSVTAAAVRNLVRIVDLQPVVSCLVAGTCMALDPLQRRLGDLAAGTLVVRELSSEFPEAPQTESEALGAPRLGEQAFRALTEFKDGRTGLEYRAAEQIAQRMRTALLEAGAMESGPQDAVRDVAPVRGQDGPATAALVAFHDLEQRRRAAARLGGAAGSAAATELLRAKRPRWTAIQARSRSRSRLAGEDAVARLAAELREVSADLARARSFGAAPALVWPLERLTSSLHARFYTGTEGLGRRAWRFATGGFPALVRRAWAPIALASALLYLPALLVFFAVSGNPGIELSIAGDEIVRRAEAAASDPTADYRDTWGGAFLGSETLSAFLIANNVQVALFAFASGATLGILTLYLLASNGVHLGSALAAFANRGVLDNIGLFIAPHGAIELTAIAIAGGAGLHLASGFWLPGRRRRLPVIAERAREGAALVAGVILMLIVAGVIEGFVSPARIAAPTKLSVAAAAAAALVAYLGTAGLQRDRS